jgi:Ca-activated chloride channel family protein
MKQILTLCMLMLIACCTIAQSTTSRIAKGNEYYKLAQYEQAENEYRAALESDPENKIAQYNLANALQKQRKFNEALHVLDPLSASATDKVLKSKSYYNQGVAHTKLKNLDASIDSYKNALRINPDDKEARENLQKALREKKKQDQQQNQQKKSDPKMSQNEAEQKLKQLQQKERELQKRMQSKNKQEGNAQKEDW